MGDAPSADVERLARLGLHLGMAFQIQDDILDTYSDSKKIGKDVGLDIANNKKTYLLISAIRLAQGEQKKELIALMNNKKFLHEEKYNKVKTIYDDLKVKELADNKVKSYFSVVEEELKSINVKNEKKIYIQEFIENLLIRQK